MRLSYKSEYAMIALAELARLNRSCSVTELAEFSGTSAFFLQQIFSELKKNRILTSVLGRGGGFTLARPANTIALAEVIRIFDDMLAPSSSVSKFHYVSTPLEKNKKAIKVFKDIRNQLANILEKKTIADLI